MLILLPILCTTAYAVIDRCMLQLFITDALILLAKYTMHVVLIFGSGIILLSFSASLHIDISTLAANFFELEKKTMTLLQQPISRDILILYSKIWEKT